MSPKGTKQARYSLRLSAIKIYRNMKIGTKLKAITPIRVFLEKTWKNVPIDKQDIGIVPVERRGNISWAGFYYTIQVGETFTFDDSNNWDTCFFRLENGLRFKKWCARPEYLINEKMAINCTEES